MREFVEVDSRTQEEIGLSRSRTATVAGSAKLEIFTMTSAKFDRIPHVPTCVYSIELRAMLAAFPVFGSTTKGVR